MQHLPLGVFHMPDKISVIVPIYNVEPYIRQFLDSIVNQTYRDLQIILVDDGSPDRCGEIADEYAAKDDRIVVVHKKNAGVSAARNDGIDMATGEWTSFVDPDDWLDLDYYERILRALPAEKPDVMITGGCYFEYPWGSCVVRSFMNTKEVDEKCRDKEYLIQKVLSDRFGNDNCFPYAALCAPWNKLFRTAFLQKEKIGFPLDIHPTEDTLFNVHVFKLTALVVPCECFGYHYRQQREQSAVNRFNLQYLAMAERIMAELTRLLGEEKLYGTYKDVSNVFTFMCLEGVLGKDYFHPNNLTPYRQTVQKIKELKEKEYFARAVWAKGIRYLGKKAVVVKYLMRLPVVWPLMVFYRLCYLRRKILGPQKINVSRRVSAF